MEKAKKQKRRPQKEARERYQDLSEEVKNKKYQYICELYRNLSEEKKTKVKI